MSAKSVKKTKQAPEHTDAQELAFNFVLEPQRQALLRWYRQHRRALPWRELWRKHRDPYHIWVSEIMLQQTVIKAVIPVYARFLERFQDVSTLARAEESEVREAVRGLGYYRRFRMLHQAAQQLNAAAMAANQKKRSTPSQPIWPETFSAWKELPGIGDYTAAAISSIAFDFPAAVVDGNVERVFCRLLDIREAPNQPRLKRIFKGLAQEFLACEAPGDFNQALMELGQTLCTPTNPLCSACPLASACLANARHSQALAPAAKIKTDMLDEQLRLGVIYRYRGEQLEIGLAPRSTAAHFLKGTEGFLTLRKQKDGTWRTDGWQADSSFLQTLQKNLQDSAAVANIRHGITRHRIRAEVIAWQQKTQRSSTASADSLLRWVPAHDVERQLVANLDRKAWQATNFAHGP